jgi:polyphenol oxidase
MSAVVVRSPLLEGAGIRHGFGTRQGGASEGSFASLNFSLRAPPPRSGEWSGDRPEHVQENLRRLGAEVGFDPGRCFRLKQVHGIDVLRVGAADSPPRLLARAGDALISDTPGTTVGVVTADCVPVLFADPVHCAVAAAHAGWRGLAGGVLEATITALGRAFGSRPADLLAAVGPCIGSCCYEVGEEVAAQFDPAAVQRDRGPKPHLDLPAAALLRLRAAGLDRSNISTAALCTRCREDLLFSYRRSGDSTGHHLSVIVVPS